MEAVNLGLATDCNTRGYKLLVEETCKILISNQVRFDETLFPSPYSSKILVDAHLINIAKLGMLDIVTGDQGETEWVKYEQSINLNDYKKYILEDRQTPTYSDQSMTRTRIWASGARISSNHCSTSALMNSCALPARWWLE